MEKTTTETRPFSVHLDEYHDELLGGLSARPGQPKTSKAEALRWCIREIAKREGVAPAEEPAA